MSTKTYVEKRIEEIQKELDTLKNSVSLPEGFIAFNPTKEDKCPCHPKDIVIVKYRGGCVAKTSYAAKDFRWDYLNNDYDVAAYKIVQKHVGPRPMKLAEIPVGVPFATNPEKPSVVYMKTNHGKTIVIYHEIKNLGRGHSFFLLNDVDYYEVKISIGG